MHLSHPRVPTSSPPPTPHKQPLKNSAGTARSHCSKIPQFLQLYQGHRIRLLRKVLFTFEFPEVRAPGYVEYMVYPDTDDEESVNGHGVLPCRETAAGLRANDEAFTDQIARLFAALKTL